MLHKQKLGTISHVFPVFHMNFSSSDESWPPII